MIDTAVHRELRLPNPTIPTTKDPTPPARPPLGLPFGHSSWLEVRRTPEGAVHYSLGAPTDMELDLTYNALQDVIPGAQLEAPEPCSFGPAYRASAFLLRSVPSVPHHYFPM